MDPLQTAFGRWLKQYNSSRWHNLRPEEVCVLVEQATDEFLRLHEEVYREINDDVHPVAGLRGQHDAGHRRASE